MTGGPVLPELGIRLFRTLYAPWDAITWWAPRGGLPGLPPADGCLRRAAVLGEAGRPGARGRAMRYREDTPAEQARARAAVAAWRGQNPEGTAEQLVDAIGGQFHPDYAVVLRGFFFAAEQVTGSIAQDAGTRAVNSSGGGLTRAALGPAPAALHAAGAAQPAGRADRQLADPDGVGADGGFVRGGLHPPIAP